MMFCGIYHDKYSNKMHLWENNNGKIEHITEEYVHEYWVPCAGNSEIKDIYGTPMIKRTIDRAKNLEPIKGLCESDINEEIKFLHKKYEGKTLIPDYNEINTAFYDIETEFNSDPKIAEAPIISITLFFSKSKNLYIFGRSDYDGVIDKESFDVKINELTYYHIADEKRMLEKFVSILHKEKTFIITGWNTRGFDNIYLYNRLEKLDSKKSLSPIKKAYEAYNGDLKIAGIADLDYLELYKRFTFSLEPNYSLNAISIKELKKGKIEYDSTLKKLHETDWNKFIEYNIVDTLLVVELEEKLKFIDRTLIMCHESLIPFDKIFSTLADHTGMLLNRLHASNTVLNDRSDIRHDKISGGYCYAKKGVFNYLLALDFKSLYPGIMIRDNIGQETLRLNPPMQTVYRLSINENKYIDLPEDTNLNIIRNGEKLKIKIDELVETDEIIL